MVMRPPLCGGVRYIWTSIVGNGVVGAIVVQFVAWKFVVYVSRRFVFWWFGFLEEYG